MGNSNQGLWRQILIDKYKVRRDGWCIPDLSHKSSGLWQSILSVKIEFNKWTRYRVHDGNIIKFWHDEWCGNANLWCQFPTLFLLDQNP